MNPNNLPRVLKLQKEQEEIKRKLQTLAEMNELQGLSIHYVKIQEQQRPEYLQAYYATAKDTQHLDESVHEQIKGQMTLITDCFRAAVQVILKKRLEAITEELKTL
jgi:conjugal transfer/entry exclusion protein